MKAVPGRTESAAFVTFCGSEVSVDCLMVRGNFHLVI